MKLIRIAIATTLAFGVLAPATAYAASTQTALLMPAAIDAQAPSASVGAAGIPEVRTSQVNAAGDVIECVGKVQYPHNSSHVNGTVNVVVTVDCTKPVPAIAIRAALYRDGALVTDSGQKTVSDTAHAQNNAAEPCHDATYQGWLSYGVAFPPGYEPPTGSASGFGDAVAITC